MLLPGNAGYELLEPFFNAASEAIRSVDDETIIFWEPVTYAYFINVSAHFNPPNMFNFRLNRILSWMGCLMPSSKLIISLNSFPY